ncbi:MAG: aminoacyl-tRNA hydrolase [Rhodobacteraceae bacterium]|nr:aminoacyl-tRNA hydrolase [Paracoccaceae bacterium]
MRLLVGLGNPGVQYQGHRHNIGFMAVQRIAEDHGFAPWKAKFHGRLAQGHIGEIKTLALCPETFVNRSGQSVDAAMRFYKLSAADVVVFHDELDLAPGQIRVKQGGGHAGHNGLRSIDQHIGTGYWRVRLGIGRPEHKAAVPNYVLQDFATTEQAWLRDLLKTVSAAVVDLLAGDPGAFMNALARHKRATMPPRDGARRPVASPARSMGPAPQADPALPAQGSAKPTSALRRWLNRFK